MTEKMCYFATTSLTIYEYFRNCGSRSKLNTFFKQRRTFKNVINHYFEHKVIVVYGLLIYGKRPTDFDKFFFFFESK